MYWDHFVSVRVGIAGAGQAGERHAIGFVTHKEAQIVGIADLNIERARVLADRYGGTACVDWRDLFKLDLDLLVVALPHDQHLYPAIEAADRSVHVLMEKPIATTLKDAHQIIRACSDANVKLSVSFVHRYREEIQRARTWLKLAGTPQIARESMASQRTSQHPQWITRKNTAGGGVLMYGAIHGVDRLRWLLQAEVVEVYSHTRIYTHDTEVEDGVAALLTFSNGAVATLSANAPLYRAQPTLWETEIYGSHAMVRVRTGEWAEMSSNEQTGRYEAGKDPVTSEAPFYHFARQAHDILEAIISGRQPSITGTDGLRALEVCLAIYRSAELRRPIQLNEIREEGDV